jgi:6-pyruvoyltetrahydropterin/6-carboxytetrahydropterin synthase
MFQITVEETFAAGHYLRNYRGKCENPHGHNYRVRARLEGSELDQAGLLLDFKDLKQAIRPTMERFDHQMMNDLEPFNTVNPSAENIARYFFQQIKQHLARVTGGRVTVKEVTIWETEATTATYFE